MLQFADALGTVVRESGMPWKATPTPWQRHVLIHALERLPDGRPRFRKVIVVVGRQSGKTYLLSLLSLWWLAVRRFPIILGTSTKLEYAAEPWTVVGEVMRASDKLSRFLPNDRSGGISTNNNGKYIKTVDGARYLIAPANATGGRSLSIDRLIVDELREHKTYAAWDAMIPTQNAIRDAQAWVITNMGNSESIVLNDLITTIEKQVEAGGGDQRLGGFLYTNPEGTDPEDPEALVQSNPNVGHLVDLDTLLGEAASAVSAGGEKLAGFMQEILCVKADNPDDTPVPVAMWESCHERGMVMDRVRERLEVCLDVSMDGLHVTLAAAGMDEDGKVLVEIVRAWQGQNATKDAVADLRDLLKAVKPRHKWWFPQGPAAPMKAELEALRFKPMAAADAVPACMGLAELVRTNRLRHGADPLLTDHVTNAKKWPSGDGWRFVRKGVGHVDAAYAAAGAALRARKKPAGQSGRTL